MKEDIVHKKVVLGNGVSLEVKGISDVWHWNIMIRKLFLMSFLFFMLKASWSRLIKLLRGQKIECYVFKNHWKIRGMLSKKNSLEAGMKAHRFHLKGFNV